MSFFDLEAASIETPVLRRNRSGSQQRIPTKDSLQVLARGSAKKEANDGDLLDMLVINADQKKAKKKPESSVHLDTPTKNQQSEPLIWTQNLQTPTRTQPTWGQSFQQAFGMGRKRPEEFSKELGNQSLDNLATQKIDSSAFLPASRAMKPPIRRRDSRDGSVKDEGQNYNVFPSMEDLLGKQSQSVALQPNYRREETIQASSNPLPVLPDYSAITSSYQAEIEAQKKKLERMESELQAKHKSEIEVQRKTYETHIQTLKKIVEEITKQSSEKRKRLLQDHQAAIRGEKLKSQAVLKAEIGRIETTLKWEFARKSQTYEHEISHLRKLLTQAQGKPAQAVNDQSSTNESFKRRENELQLLKLQIERKREDLNASEREFSMVQAESLSKIRLEAESLGIREKRIVQKESQLKLSELNQKRNLALEKQDAAKQLVEQQLQLVKQKEVLRQQQAAFTFQKELFEREKNQNAQFNAKVVDQCQLRLQEAARTKENINHLQIQLNEKLVCAQLQLPADQMHSRPKSISHRQGGLDTKLMTARQRYGEIESWLKQNSQPMAWPKTDLTKVLNKKYSIKG